MSQHVQNVAVTELALVRLSCRARRSGDGSGPDDVCGATLEVSLGRLAEVFAHKPCCCPACGEPLGIRDPLGQLVNPYPALVKALRDLQAIAARVVVEFVLPVSE